MSKSIKITLCIFIKFFANFCCCRRKRPFNKCLFKKCLQLQGECSNLTGWHLLVRGDRAIKELWTLQLHLIKLLQDLATAGHNVLNNYRMDSFFQQPGLDLLWRPSQNCWIFSWFSICLDWFDWY